MYPFREIMGALSKAFGEAGYYQTMGFQYPRYLFLSINGKKNLAEIRDMLNFELKPVSAEDFLKAVEAFEKAGLIKMSK